MEALQLKRYTYEEYAKWPEQPRYELIDGIPYLMASPGRKHQEISSNLMIEIGSKLKGKPCKPYHAPFDVRLFPTPFGGGDTVVQPDILVICDKSKLDDRGAKGAPEFVIEILSPSSGKMDEIIKKKKYEQAGVLEYWVIDPVHRIVSVYLLKNGAYAPAIKYTPEDVVPVTVIPGLEIDLAEIFPPLEEEPEATYAE